MNWYEEKTPGRFHSLRIGRNGSMSEIAMFQQFPAFAQGSYDVKQFRRLNVNPGIADAVRFWEQRRIAYNLLLTMVFVGWVVVSWPSLKGAFSLVHFAQLAVLALIANVLYCAVYLAELFLKDLAASKWHHCRWGIWIVGTLFAILVESYWVNDEIIAPLIH